MAKKSHNGACAWTFKHYVGGKCRKCGYRKAGRYYCGYPDCKMEKTVKHFCVGR